MGKESETSLQNCPHGPVQSCSIPSLHFFNKQLKMFMHQSCCRYNAACWLTQFGLGLPLWRWCLLMAWPCAVVPHCSPPPTLHFKKTPFRSNLNYKCLHRSVIQTPRSWFLIALSGCSWRFIHHDNIINPHSAVELISHASWARSFSVAYRYQLWWHGVRESSWPHLVWTDHRAGHLWGSICGKARVEGQHHVQQCRHCAKKDVLEE